MATEDIVQNYVEWSKHKFAIKIRIYDYQGNLKHEKLDSSV